MFWILVFLGVATLAGIFAFSGLATASAGIAQLLFVIFLGLFFAAILGHALYHREH